MKAFITILVTFIYLTASSGAPVRLQLCKEQVVAMKIWLGGVNEDRSNCANDCPSGKEKTKGCCKSKQQQLKVDTYNDSADSLVKSLSQVILPGYPKQEALTPASSLLVEYPKSNGPPATGRIALYIKNCTFII